MTSRRDFLRHSALGALGLTSLGAFVAACSGDDDTPARATVRKASTPTTAPLDPDTPWWLQGNFAPVTKEVEATALKVHGELPAALSGLYVRNGSNPKSGWAPHWFLGDGMVHGVMLDGGKASWYRNRYVQTALLAAGGGLTASGAPGGASSLANVSLVYHGKKLLALGEVGLPYEISPRDCSTTGVYDFSGGLNGGSNVTAHPKIDPATGQMHFFGYEFGAPFLRYYVADADGKVVTAQGVDVKASTMIHDFAITERDVVFWEFPVLFDFDLAIQMVSDPKSTIMPFVWTPSYGSRIGVMPLGGPTSAIRWVEIENGYVFHGVNAFRDADEVVVDVCRMPKVFDGGALGPSPAMHRWRIDTAGPSLTFRDEVLSDRPADLPSIDRRHAGREYRHSWRVEVGTRTDTAELKGVVHYDTRTGKEQRYDPGLTKAGDEWLFVAGGPDEADGYLLTYLYDAATDSSELVVLRATDVAAGPIARVELPQRVPFGFHATWVPAAEV
jgi:carotenoid cleavage dioxygenase